MNKSTRNWWIGGGVILIFIALVTWLGTLPEQPAPSISISPAIKISADVLAPPVDAKVGVPVSVLWEARAPVGAVATAAAIYWGSTSKRGTFGEDVAPSMAGYQNLLPDYYLGGSFALPRKFSGALTFPAAGTYYYRAYAALNGKHYWSPEYAIVVQ